MTLNLLKDTPTLYYGEQSSQIILLPIHKYQSNGLDNKEVMVKTNQMNGGKHKHQSDIVVTKSHSPQAGSIKTDISYHCYKSSYKSEVHQVIWVYIGGWIDL